MFCFVFLICFFLFVSFVIVVVFCFVLFFFVASLFVFISPGFCMCFTLETMRIRIACCLELLVVKLHVGRFLSVSVRLSYQKECLGVITEITKLGGICANALLCLEQSSSHLLPTPTVSVTGHFLVVYSSKTERQTVRRGRQRQRKKKHVYRFRCPFLVCLQEVLDRLEGLLVAFIERLDFLLRIGDQRAVSLRQECSLFTLGYPLQ